MDFAATAAAAAGLVIVTATAIHAGIYLRAAARRAPDAQAAAPCDVAASPRAATTVRLVLAETVASLWIALAAVCPARSPLGDPGGARLAVLLIAPPWLPRGALAVLARRLAGRGALVDLARLPCRRHTAALARVVARADRLRRAGRAHGLALVCYGSASASAGALLALAPARPAPRLILLGAPPAPSSALPPHAVAIRAAGDPWHPPPPHEPAGMGAIELVAVGHVSLLVAPHVADVVYDACADGEPPPGRA